MWTNAHVESLRASSPYVVNSGFYHITTEVPVSQSFCISGNFPPQAKISCDGDDFHNLVTLIAAVTVRIEINFDFLLFLLSASNVTNGIIFGSGWERCSRQLEEHCWPELSMWGHFLLGDNKRFSDLWEGSQWVGVIYVVTKHHISGRCSEVVDCLLYISVTP